MSSLAVVDDVDGNSDEEVLSLADQVNDLNLSKTDKVVEIFSADWKNRKEKIIRDVKHNFVLLRHEESNRKTQEKYNDNSIPDRKIGINSEVVELFYLHAEIDYVQSELGTRIYNQLIGCGALSSKHDYTIAMIKKDRYLMKSFNIMFAANLSDDIKTSRYGYQRTGLIYTDFHIYHNVTESILKNELDKIRSVLNKLNIHNEKLDEQLLTHVDITEIGDRRRKLLRWVNRAVQKIVESFPIPEGLKKEKKTKTKADAQKEATKMITQAGEKMTLDSEERRSQRLALTNGELEEIKADLTIKLKEELENEVKEVKRQLEETEYKLADTENQLEETFDLFSISTEEEKEALESLKPLIKSWKGKGKIKRCYGLKLSVFSEILNGSTTHGNGDPYSRKKTEEITNSDLFYGLLAGFYDEDDFTSDFNLVFEDALNVGSPCLAIISLNNLSNQIIWQHNPQLIFSKGRKYSFVFFNFKLSFSGYCIEDYEQKAEERRKERKQQQEKRETTQQEKGDQIAVAVPVPMTLAVVKKSDWNEDSSSDNEVHAEVVA